ncbi:Hypothetical_protein [Hexamita inflata]|uniref:Hypothetical_protein n=1 Tax=Hexamita inflata TaxID=28002 RepID=A0ABP1GE45_9EUKA
MIQRLKFIEMAQTNDCEIFESKTQDLARPYLHFQNGLNPSFMPSQQRSLIQIYRQFENQMVKFGVEQAVKSTKLYLTSLMMQQNIKLIQQSLSKLIYMSYELFVILKTAFCSSPEFINDPFQKF